MADTKEHGCHVERLAPSKGSADRATTEAHLLIEGMGCSNCAARVYNALVSVAGVGAAEVWLRPPIASVRYDPGQVSLNQLVSAVAAAGALSHHHYGATPL